MKVKGNYLSRRIWVNDKEIFPNEGQKLRNHSPDGFNWGYGGSGPSQLALSLTVEALKRMNLSIKDYWMYYQNVKWKFIASLPPGDFEQIMDIEQFIEKHENTSE